MAEQPVTMGQILDACIQASERNAKLTWVDENFLLEQKVHPWTELSL